MNMKLMHTPTPWKKDNMSATTIWSGSGLVADCPHFTGVRGDAAKPIDERAANAAFIVKACNAHDELVAALRRAVEAAEARMPHATFLSDARAALAKAGAL